MHLRLKFLFLSFIFFQCRQPQNKYESWEVYRAGSEGNCYSGLDQVNIKNVQDLKVAWTFHTGDSGASIQCNPIIVDGTMYLTSPALKLFAVNAASGKMEWTFDPFKNTEPKGVNRGVAYWQEGNDKRIFFTAGYYLYALNAATGALIGDFGNQGEIDLRNHLDRDTAGIDIEVTSPGMIFKDLLILGSRVSESEGAAPGHVRAYNVRTGEIAWIFHTIPQPGEESYDSWEDKEAYKHIGGANTWSGFTLDEKRGWVFFATGSCAPDFYGGDRKGQNLFANSVVTLDAATGKKIWHYQVVHHDLWDYDLPTPPNLVIIKQDGKIMEAVAQATKTGNVFVLNRETGKPIFPVEERSVPTSDIKGEKNWPTQPFPLKPQPFVRQKYAADDITTLSAKAHDYAMEKFRNSRNEGIFTPPSKQGSIVFPGMRGGAEWNGASFDMNTGILYINANEIPNIMALKELETVSPADNNRFTAGKNIFQSNCATCHGVDRKGQSPYPSLINIFKKMDRQKINHLIQNGKGQMPAFPNLSKEKINAIVNYLHDADNQPEKVASKSNEATDTIRYAHTGYGQFLDPDGYPAVKPPWGTLNAINLNTGELVWRIPLGEYPELTKRGISPTGTQNFGGSIVTAGGLVFVGGSKDEKFRAFDKSTGKLIWETVLPAGGYATPATYQVNGKQYIVIAAGGGGKNGTKTGDAYVAFALP